jgi:hypothetical protein
MESNMLTSNMRKLTLKGLTLVVLAFNLLVFSKDSTKTLLASPQALQDSALPVVSIAPQDNPPLRILSGAAESFGEQQFRVQVIMQNQSNKIIRCYSLIAENLDNGVMRTEFVNLSGSRASLQPTQVVPDKLTFTDHAERLRLAIDFVEFSDGTTWGPDNRNSRDRLDGMRMGARTEKQRLKSILKANGPAAVFDYIATGEITSDLEAAKATNHSDEWRQGFRSGSGAIRNRFTRFARSSTPNQIELELEKPFDSSENPK